jgi:hypothetical protein
VIHEVEEEVDRGRKRRNSTEERIMAELQSRILAPAGIFW